MFKFHFTIDRFTKPKNPHSKFQVVQVSKMIKRFKGWKICIPQTYSRVCNQTKMSTQCTSPRELSYPHFKSRTNRSAFSHFALRTLLISPAFRRALCSPDALPNYRIGSRKDPKRALQDCEALLRCELTSAFSCIKSPLTIACQNWVEMLRVRLLKPLL